MQAKLLLLGRHYGAAS